MAVNRRLAAVMFTDLVGFTASAQADEASALRMLQEEEDLVRPIFAADHGREIKSTGDGFLVEFDSALHAVQCAIDIHQRLRERNSVSGGAPITLRIGVHLGDVEERGNDIFGDAVNVAARIQPHARAGGICISDRVYAQVRNQIPNPIERLAPKKLKNVRVPLDLYRVVLPWESSRPTSADVSPTRIAVLPLQNISPDPSDEYVADGLTEELISTLSKIRELRVIARTSVNQYKLSNRSAAQIASDLDVGSILEGSVRKLGNRVRVTLQLIDATTEEPVWTETYDRQLDDVFALESEIADRTAGSLRVRLLDPERDSIRKGTTSNAAAYSLYLKGIHAAREATYEGYDESIRLFEGAIREDPAYPPPYSALANIYVLLAGETLAPSRAFPRAKELVTRALELDPDSAEAHTARGNLALQYHQDWETAEREFKWSISINPSHASAHFWYAMMLNAAQRFDQAIEQLHTTIELDPLWSLPKMMLVAVLFSAGDFRTAFAEAEEERDRDPGAPGPHIDLGTIYARTGRLAEARREAELSAGDVSEYDRMNRAILWSRLGSLEEARALAGQLEEAARSGYVNPTRLAALYAALGATERALAWLERDYVEGTRGLWFDYQLMAFDTLRPDPRFQAMLERLHLPVDVTPVARSS